jgi:hypothetical protein
MVRGMAQKVESLPSMLESLKPRTSSPPSKKKKNPTKEQTNGQINVVQIKYLYVERLQTKTTCLQEIG